MDKSRFRFREATKEDIPGMVDTFFHSLCIQRSETDGNLLTPMISGFNAPFWQYFVPDTKYMRQWWIDSFRLSLDNPTDRSFVVEDTQSSGKIAAFSRWQVPQEDGNQERKWPDMSPKEFDMELVEAFFGGMEENRKELMGLRPHWFLELLATHEDYQRLGLGSEQILWGTDQADKENLESYLDASERGRPFYLAHHNFKHGKDIDIPDRPSYGHFHYVSLVRPSQKVE